MANGIQKNLEVVRQELSDYRVHIAIAMHKVKTAKGIGRKLHHLSGLGPDMYRTMPRTLWYSGGVLSIVAGAGYLYLR